MPDTFHANRSFLTPAFEIRLNGAPAGREVIADVLDVSFSDDLAAVSSFEFSLNDWDPIALRPKYSSPWDEDGKPYHLPDDGPEIPNFEPGTKVALYLGYRDEGDLPLIMEGEVVSISTAFPAAGQPVAKVRVLDALLRGLQKTWVTGNYDGTAKAIVQTLCDENGVSVEWPAGIEEGEPQENVQIDGPLFDAIDQRAKDYGLRLVSRPVTSSRTSPALGLVQPGPDNETPLAEFIWGRTLVSFSPVLSAAAQVGEVAARGADPDADADSRAIEVVKTWADIGLSQTALGPSGSAEIDNAVRGTREVIKPDDCTSVEAAEAAALARLRELAAELITGSGVSVGLPEMRAGSIVKLTGLGARFSGEYRLTKTTHTLGAAGYTTGFSASKLVLKP